MTTELEIASKHKLHEQLVQVISISKKSFVVMGKILRDLKKKDSFKLAIGQGIDTWEEYLRQPEVGLSVGEANRLIQIYEEFVLRLGYDEDTVANIPVKNAYYLLPLIKNLKTKYEADELVVDATLLTQKDFRELIYEKKVAAGEIEREYEYLIMRKTVLTGLMDKVHGINSDMIKKAFGLE